MNAITADLSGVSFTNGAALSGGGGGFCVVRPPLIETLSTCWPFTDAWRPPAASGPQTIYDATGSMSVMAPGQRVPRPWACAWRLIPPPGCLVEFAFAGAAGVSGDDVLRVSDARTGRDLLNATVLAGAPAAATSLSEDGLLIEYSAAYVGPVRTQAQLGADRRHYPSQPPPCSSVRFLCVFLRLNQPPLGLAAQPSPKRPLPIPPCRLASGRLHRFQGVLARPAPVGSVGRGDC